MVRTKCSARRQGYPSPNAARGGSSHGARQEDAPSPFRSVAHKRFFKNQTRARPFVQERRLALENSIFDTLPVTPIERGWAVYAEHPSRCCANVVREFIANARSLPDTEELDRFTSYVRGHWVRFDSETIRDLMGFPGASPCHLDEMRRGSYDPTEVLNTVSDGCDSWRMGADLRPKSLKRQHLKPIAMEFLTYILSNIIPSKHCSEVTLDRVFILYIMLTGKNLDLPRVLANEISVCINSTRGIVLPSLIYKLCLRAGVPGGIEEPIFPGDMLGLRMLNRKKPRMEEPGEAEQEEEELRRRASCSNIGQDSDIIEMLRSMDTKLTRLNSSVDDLSLRMTKLEKIGHYWKKKSAALKRFLLGKKKRPEDSSPSSRRKEIARGKRVEGDEDVHGDSSSDDSDLEAAILESRLEDEVPSADESGGVEEEEEDED